MLKLELRHLGALLDALAGQGKVYAPFRQGGRTDFAWYDGTAGRDAAALDLEHHTARAPKDVLFPQVEDLLRFRQQGKKLGLEAASLPTESVVAFGVRGCDTAGFAILDKVFLQDPADLYYRARRDSLTVLGLACGELEETCFCRTFGLDPAAPGGDVDLWLAGGALYWQARTDKGRRFPLRMPRIQRQARQRTRYRRPWRRSATPSTHRTTACPWRSCASTTACTTTSGKPSGVLCGGPWRPRASRAVPVLMYALPATVLTCGTRRRRRARRNATAAGTAAWTAISRKCPTATRARARRNGSGSATCTNWSIFPRTTAALTPARAAGVACRRAP